MIQNKSNNLGSEVYFKVQHVSVSCLNQKLQIKTQKKFFRQIKLKQKEINQDTVIDLFEKSKGCIHLANQNKF